MPNLNEIFYHLFPKNKQDIGEIYGVTFQIQSDTHFTNGLSDTFKTLNDGKFPLISFQENNEKIFVTINRTKSNFFDPSKQTETFKFKFEEIINDYIIGLSIISRGIFFPFRLGNLAFDYELFDSEFGKIDIEVKIEGKRPTRFNRKAIHNKKRMHLYQFIFPLFWTSYKQKLKWGQIHYFYSKALILLSQFDIVDRFFDETFMLFYKTFENIATFDILRKRKLKNEFKELQMAIEMCVSDYYLKNQFKELYKLRCRVLAHSQNTKHELATFKNVLEMKRIVDYSILNQFLYHFLNYKSLGNISPSPTRT